MDPFHGSGTILFETIKKVDKVYGIDINPFANLITEVKLAGVTKNIDVNISDLEYLILNCKNANIHMFDNIDKWFRTDIKNDLSIIRHCIMQIKSNRDRKYFWCMFSQIIRKYCNSRNTTFKLHTQTEEHIKSKKNEVIRDFISIIKKNKLFYCTNNPKRKYDVILNDTKKQLKKFKNNEIDMIVTSPPYGDNATTITYGQYSILALKWIDEKDLKIKYGALDNYSMIDSLSLGGNKFKNRNNYDEDIEPIIASIGSIAKKKKVKVFFEDYFEVLDELSRICDKYIVLTLGNRVVDGITIDLTKYSKIFLEHSNFECIEEFSRNILNKRIPSKVSTVNGKSVESMSKEYILILRRIHG